MFTDLSPAGPRGQRPAHTGPFGSHALRNDTPTEAREAADRSPVQGPLLSHVDGGQA
jgi:hypothetical protein